MISPISSRVTPLFSARSRWPGSWSVRYMAINAATVMKLRSRLESPGRSQTSPKSTFSLRATSFGAAPRTTSRALDVTGCVLTVCSFHGDEVIWTTTRDSTRFGRLTPAGRAASIPTTDPTIPGGQYAPTHHRDPDGRLAAPCTARRVRAGQPCGPRPHREGDGRRHRQVDPVCRQRSELLRGPELRARHAVAPIRGQELHAVGELRNCIHPG